MAETVEEPLQPINHNKTCVLKASIHCEGCKRKVKKILSQVQGVEHVDVDTKQQKVTVTGNVDAGTLIKKLTKSGKHAQLWPQKQADKTHKAYNHGGLTTNEKLEATQPQAKPDQQAKPTSSNVSKEPEPEPEPEPKAEKCEANGGPGEKAVSDAPAKTRGGADAVEVAKSEDGSKTEEGFSGEVEPPPPKAADNGGEVLGGKDVKKKKKKGQLGSSTSGAPAPQGRESGDNGGEGLGGKDVKKKKKKGQIGNSTSGAPEPQCRESGDPPLSANHSPPRHHHDEATRPFHHYTPSYAVSYNTAYPTSNYTASYYPEPEPYSSYAYTYPGPGMETQPPPSDHRDQALYPQQQPLDSFEMFSDENPNGCSIT